MTTSSIWRARAGLGILALGALAAACAPGTRANSQSPTGVSAPAATAVTPVLTPVAGASGPATAPGATATPAAAPTDPSADPLTTADAQSADQSLSQIETDLSSTDQATATGENDVPSN